MGLRFYEHVWEAKKQLKQAISELVDLRYIKQPTWDGFTIQFTPEVRFTFGEEKPSKSRKAKAQMIDDVPRQLQINSVVAVVEELHDPLWPLCTLYAKAGWKLAEIQAKRRNLSEEQLKKLTKERGIVISA